jgi:hypothetical protein
MAEQMIGKPDPMPKMGSLKQATGQRTVTDRPTMTPSEIIQNSAQKRKINPGSLMQRIAKDVQSQRTKLLQIGDTVFLLRMQGPSSAEVSIISDETNKLPERIKAMTASAKQMGLSNLSILSTNAQSIQTAAKTGLKYKQGMSQTMRGGSMMPAYRFDIQL